MATENDLILVAKIFANENSITVLADKINEGLVSLIGKPKANMRITASIEFDAMTKSDFLANQELLAKSSESKDDPLN